MKKRLLSLFLALLMLAAFAGTASAADYHASEDNTYTIELSGKTPGKEYSIVIVAGDYAGKAMPEIDADSIIYLDQVTADENGKITFTAFIPMTESVGTVYIGGDEEPSEEGILMTESGFGYSDGTLISFTGTSDTVIIPDGITAVAENAFEADNEVKRIIARYGDVKFAVNSIASGTMLFLSPVAAMAKEYAIKNGYSYAVFGDYTEDGTVDRADYMAYLGNTVSGTKITDTDRRLILDIDNSGDVNLRDASVLLRFLAGTISDYFEAFTDKDSVMTAQ